MTLDEYGQSRKRGYDAFHRGEPQEAPAGEPLEGFSWMEGWHYASEGESWEPAVPEKGSRYRAVRGSESGHCCFEATVIDLKKPEYHPFHGYFYGYYEGICETFDFDDAVTIAAALNTLAD